MNRLLIVGILAISTTPLYAQGQQPNIAKLKADAQKVASIIKADKAKSQTYCQISNANEQMIQEKDRKKAAALFQRMHEMEKQLGPEYLALVDGLKDVNPSSKDGREIFSQFDSLDQSCPH